MKNNEFVIQLLSFIESLHISNNIQFKKKNYFQIFIFTVKTNMQISE